MKRRAWQFLATLIVVAVVFHFAWYLAAVAAIIIAAIGLWYLAMLAARDSDGRLAGLNVGGVAFNLHAGGQQVSKTEPDQLRHSASELVTPALSSWQAVSKASRYR
jgi:hypothetical protein